MQYNSQLNKSENHRTIALFSLCGHDTELTKSKGDGVLAWTWNNPTHWVSYFRAALAAD